MVPLKGVMAPPQRVETPQRPFQLVTDVWSTANNPASLTARSRPDQLTEPTESNSTGEYAFDADCSMTLIQPILRGAATHVLTFNLWRWRQLIDKSGNTMAWHPWLVGRWTATFAGAGTATVGVAGGPVLASTDIYCSNLVVVATYDRRGDYTKLWQILQPAVDDGSPAELLVDTVGGCRYTIEGRTTTNSEGFNFAVAGVSTV